jgi:hypothetical protein
MQVPEFHNNLAPGADDAIVRIREISDYFRHAERMHPRLRRLRIDAILRLRELGMSVPDIAEETGMAEHRIRDVLKEERRLDVK